ncbi:Tyrosine-protein kinase, catalytic domain [Phytophthora cactorum]|nr:Tyrosine-protein kinase, catalytic domain [Phytophthora cactorum]
MSSSSSVSSSGSSSSNDNRSYNMGLLTSAGRSKFGQDEDPLQGNQASSNVIQEPNSRNSTGRVSEPTSCCQAIAQDQTLAYLPRPGVHLPDSDPFDARSPEYRDIGGCGVEQRSRRHAGYGALSLGDLLTYLQNYGDYTSWERGKYRLAFGIARALAYLHSQPTPVAHRDLRASNVLLTETMRPKLTGFDSSCLDEHSHRCHVAGAPYWSAPEVLRGRPYTAKSDIYAFGVLLTELDTASAPFHEAVSPVGTKLKPIQILNEVMQGTLRPSFSSECPRRIRVIGVGCYQHDPDRRPTAAQLLRLLEASFFLRLICRVFGISGIHFKCQFLSSGLKFPKIPRRHEQRAVVLVLCILLEPQLVWGREADHLSTHRGHIGGHRTDRANVDEYEATECTAFNCTQLDGTAGYNNDKCTGTQMFTGVKCVVEEHEQSNQGLAMWSIGGESTTPQRSDLSSTPDGHIQRCSAVWINRRCTVSSAHRRAPTLFVAARRRRKDSESEDQGSPKAVEHVELVSPDPTHWMTSGLQSLHTHAPRLTIPCLMLDLPSLYLTIPDRTAALPVTKIFHLNNSTVTATNQPLSFGLTKETSATQDRVLLIHSLVATTRQQVLRKRLAPSPNVNVAAVDDLAFEIQQRAHVRHPNLVQFIGAGWTSVHDLGMVVEYLPHGSLRAYLDQNKSSLDTWTPQKTVITGGIARALAYLHEQNYVHNNICAKKVLLTDKLEAKLASCESIATSPSSGAKVNSRQALWLAPEVPNGAPYSPAADIYSFGALLTELDTCEMPYLTLDQRAGML